MSFDDKCRELCPALTYGLPIFVSQLVSAEVEVAPGLPWVARSSATQFLNPKAWLCDAQTPRPPAQSNGFMMSLGVGAHI